MTFSSVSVSTGLHVPLPSSARVFHAAMAFGFVGRFGFRAVCFSNPAAWLAADLILLTLYRREIRKLDREPEFLLRLMQASGTAKLKHAAAK